jgi:hypothetical protein
MKIGYRVGGNRPTICTNIIIMVGIRIEVDVYTTVSSWEKAFTWLHYE